jgi:23S rRNA (cytosine1962-C5)-methyltransferase
MAQPRRSPRKPPRGAPIVRKNTVRLSGDVAARVRAGHPWVYREALGPRPIAPEPGTQIDLIDPDGEFVGRALYDADSAIALRVFVRNPDTAIDGKLVRDRVRAAVALRKRVLDYDRLGSMRLVNGESDGLPGIVVERYGEYLVTQLYSAAVSNLRDELYNALSTSSAASGRWPETHRARPVPTSFAEAPRRSSSRSSRTT